MAQVPFGALAFGALGVAAAVRTFYRPYRAVVRDGYALRCAGGAGCEPLLTIESMRGVAPVFAVSPGVVTSVRKQGHAVSVELTSSREPVVLTYRLGSPEMPAPAASVQEGARVGVGQTLGMAERVAFGVERVTRHADGGLQRTPLVPSAWLAARGLRISAKARQGERQWCEGGRRLQVPEQALKCGMELPEPGGFMLLPVSVSTA